jgi:hypothetical protein
MKSLPSALGWSGLVLILTPIAAGIALFAVLVAPKPAIVVGGVLGCMAVKKLLGR